MKQQNNRFQEGAIRIGDEILSRRKENRHGYSWETMTLQGTEKIGWNVTESIYSGVGGIVLFFVELYKQTSDERYLEAAVKGTDWLLAKAKQNPTTYYAFFSGRMGLAYVFLQMHRLTKEPKYIKEALQVALKSPELFNHTRRVDDLINGTSGTLLGLMLLHSATNEEKLLPLIEQFTEHLINHVYHGPKGLYWDKNTNQIRGLCGFSHGAAGLGYVFFQLGYYFDNPSFYWFAEQAFMYENYFFDEVNGNWPDFQKGIYSEDDFEKHKQAYIHGNTDFFLKPGSMMAWCHGAPGIGLSRLHAWQLLKKEYLKKDMDRALDSTRKVTLSPLNPEDSYTLCHGKGGNAMLFLEVYKHLRDEKIYQWAKKTASQALDFKNKFRYYRSGFFSSKEIDKEDLSLFMGNAGIGYFYLMCAAPEKIPSILAPSVKTVCKKDAFASFDLLNARLPQLQRKVLARAYPGTVSVFEQLQQSNEESFFDQYSGTRDVKSAFEGYVRHSINNLYQQQSNQLQAVFGLEKKKMEIELHSNPSFQNIKTILLQAETEQLLSLSKEKFLRTELKLNKDVTIVEMHHHDKRKTKGQQVSALLQSVVLFRSPQGVQEYPVSTFTKEILEIFTEPKKIYEVKEQLIHKFDLNGQEDKSKFEELFLEQIRECIHSLFLIKPKNN